MNSGLSSSCKVGFYSNSSIAKGYNCSKARMLELNKGESVGTPLKIDSTTGLKNTSLERSIF